MHESKAMEILERERGTKLCPVALDALHAVLLNASPQLIAV